MAAIGAKPPVTVSEIDAFLGTIGTKNYGEITEILQRCRQRIVELNEKNDALQHANDTLKNRELEVSPRYASSWYSSGGDGTKSGFMAPRRPMAA